MRPGGPEIVSFAALRPRATGSYFRGGSVLMLNSPNALPSFFDQLWTKDAFRACADGAVNRLFHADVSPLPPHAIVGDLDSASAQVLRHYERVGAAIVRRPSQDMTDMEKLLSYPPVEDARLHRVGRTAVLGGLGGLLSHQFANLNVSLKACMDHRFTPLIFLDEHETVFVVRPGRTVFEDVPNGIHCSLVPVFGAVNSITTKGLRWDLSKQQLAFGSLVSTSNLCTKPEVVIDSSDYFLWTFERRTD